MNPTLREEQTREAREAVEKHGGVAAAARALGLARSTLDARVRRTFPEPEQVQEKQSIETSGLKAENARLKNYVAELESGGKRLPVKCTAEPTIEIDDLWRKAEDENGKRIKRSAERHNFALTLDRGPVCVVFLSDQHISIDNTVDMARMREDAELIRDTEGADAILGGDLCDNHIKHSAAILAARSQPHEQWQLAEHYLNIFASKIICLIDGNHDKWTDQKAGIDMVSWIARDKRLYYAPDEARIDLTVGKVMYKLAVRHQYRFNSTFNLLHTVKQWWAHGEAPFDIGCIGHHHRAATESFWFHGEQCWGCRPGSYQITSAYGRQYGFNSVVPRAPSFILWPDERRIIGLPDIRDALKLLKAER
jgi:predicted phosphodiesterase